MTGLLLQETQSLQIYLEQDTLTITSLILLKAFLHTHSVKY